MYYSLNPDPDQDIAETGSRGKNSQKTSSFVQFLLKPLSFLREASSSSKSSLNMKLHFFSFLGTILVLTDPAH
jgi:hypothetical protein